MPTLSGLMMEFQALMKIYKTIQERDELMDMLAESVRYIILGFCIPAHILSEVYYTLKI